MSFFLTVLSLRRWCSALLGSGNGQSAGVQLLRRDLVWRRASLRPHHLLGHVGCLEQRQCLGPPATRYDVNPGVAAMIVPAKSDERIFGKTCFSMCFTTERAGFFSGDLRESSRKYITWMPQKNEPTPRKVCQRNGEREERKDYFIGVLATAQMVCKRFE